MNILCILGRIDCKTEGVTVDDKTAIGNSSRWIFDVEAEAKTQSFEFILLDYRSKKPKPQGLMSLNVMQLNEAAARALIFAPMPDKILLTLMVPRAVDPPITGPILFRVTVDGLHTLMR